MKKLGLSSILIVFLAIIAACGAEPVDIGIILPTQDEPRWLQDRDRFEELETDYDVDILFSDGDSATESENVDALLTRGMQVLIIGSVNAEASAAAVEKAKEDGVTVISYDRLILDTEAVDYYVAFDSFNVGEIQGQYLVDQIPTGATDLPLYLYAGRPTDNNAKLFFEGAWSVLHPYIQDGTFSIENSSEAVSAVAANDSDDTTLTDEQSLDIRNQIDTDWFANTAKTLADNNITAATAAGGSLTEVFVLAPNDTTSRGIFDAFDEADAGTVHITGQDVEIASIISIIDGDQSMSVFKDVRVLAETALDLAVDILDEEEITTTAEYNNGTKEVPSYSLEILEVTVDNYIELLVDTDYYTREDLGLPAE